MQAHKNITFEVKKLHNPRQQDKFSPERIPIDKKEKTISILENSPLHYRKYPNDVIFKRPHKIN